MLPLNCGIRMGRVLPRSADDGRVDFTGPIFTFTLPPSDTTEKRQAVTIEFFRRNAEGGNALAHAADSCSHRRR